MSVGLLDHLNIRTLRLADTTRFYEEILGLQNGDRPDFSFPGAWLYSEGSPVVRLAGIPPSAELQNPYSSVVHHIAFSSRDFKGMQRHLHAKGMAFETETAGGELWRIFIRDPNGLMIELNYEAIREQG
jgi:catechol 2,3-dioxygenase-like lactoylglutathione lyase family enzyme